MQWKRGKPVVKAIGFLAVWLLAFAVLGCGAPVSGADPERPSSVPMDAVWRGGMDGGHWIACSLTSPTRLECDTYRQTGPLYSRFEYKLCVVDGVSEIPGYELGYRGGIEANADAFQLVPTQPGIFFSGGVVDQTLTAKSASEWDQTELPICLYEVEFLEGP